MIFIIVLFTVRYVFFKYVDVYQLIMLAKDFLVSLVEKGSVEVKRSVKWSEVKWREV